MSENYIVKVRGLLKDKPTYEKFSTLINMGHDIDFIKEVYPDLIYTFGDLKFTKHGNIYIADQGGKQAILNFDNGHWVSVVGGATGLYGDGINTFEVGYPLSKNDMDVMAYLSPDEVTDLMIEIQMKYPL
jgi:hypothetical protein